MAKNRKTPAAARRRYLRHRAWVDAYKLEHGCADCGYNAHAAVLDFDHRDPSTKVMTIASNTIRSLAVLKAEIEKCDVVCANCHRIRTTLGRQNGTIHANVRQQAQTAAREPGNVELLRLPL